MSIACLSYSYLTAKTRHWCVFGCICVFLYVDAFFQSRIPTVGYDGILTSYVTAFGFLRDAQTLLKVGYDQVREYHYFELFHLEKTSYM